MRDKEQATKRDSRKLALSKETIRRLAKEELTTIQGGTGDTADCTLYCQPCTSGDPRCTCPSFI